MIFLDTHVVMWLFRVDEKKISRKAREAISSDKSRQISPMVELELSCLHEVGKINYSVEEIMSSLSKTLGLSVAQSDFSQVIELAKTNIWTRDVFDRVIVAEAMLHKAPLVTKDKTIRKNYLLAVW